MGVQLSTISGSWRHEQERERCEGAVCETMPSDIAIRAGQSAQEVNETLMK